MDRPIRLLLPWLDQAEAVRSLLGYAPPEGQDVSDQVAQWNEKRTALAARAPYTGDTPVIEPLPDALADRAVAFGQRGDVQILLAGLQWQLGIADLTRVLSYQTIVVLDDVQGRVAAATQNDWDSLFSVCLPDPAPAEKRPVIIDLDGKGITLSSLNPNLRVLAHARQQTELASPAGGTMAATVFGFVVKHYPSVVQVVQYKNRWFLRDGYHRCYGLMAKGITRVPCAFIQANDFQQTGAQQPGFLPEAVLFSERPPLVKDFLDDAVSVAAQQRATRKVVRITAQEFVVEV